MYTTAVRREFTARHFLRGDFGPESDVHDHRYVVELRIQVPSLDHQGFGTDISAMERVLEAELDAIDAVLLNDLPYFEARQPSVENLCTFLWDRFRNSGCVPAGARTMEVLIWEHERAWASYSSDVEFRR